MTSQTSPTARKLTRVAFVTVLFAATLALGADVVQAQGARFLHQPDTRLT